MSRFGSLSAALRLVRGGKSSSSKELLKVKILNQLLNDGKIDLELDSKDSYIEIKPTRAESKVPFKDLHVMRIHLNKCDADLLTKAERSQPALGLGLVSKDQIDQMSTIVVIFTMAQFGFKIIMELKDLINGPRTFLADILNSSKNEREMRECLVKISKNIQRIKEQIGMQNGEGVDESGGGNTAIEEKDGCNDGAAAAKAKEDNDNIEVRGENAAANSTSAERKEEGNVVANPTSAERKEEGSAEPGREEEGSSESE